MPLRLSIPTLLCVVVVTVCRVVAAVQVNLQLPDREFSAQQDHRPPQWPEQYEVTWEFRVPYVSRLQTTPLAYEYQAWRDETNNRQKLTREGVETLIEFVDNGTVYEIFPRMDEFGCRSEEMASGGGPTAQRRLLADDGPSLTFVLPDLSEPRWEYNSTVNLGGQVAHEYTWVLQEDQGYGEVTAYYRFYVTDAGTPIKLHTWGINLYTGGHYDEYIVTFKKWVPGPVDESVFVVPQLCDNETAKGIGLAAPGRGGLRARVASMFPNVHYGDATYDAFVHKFGRRHKNRLEYEGRRQVFSDNKALVEGWNAARNSSHTLGINHFADWTHEEWLDVMLPKRRGISDFPQQRLGQPPKQHVACVGTAFVPKSVDWRGTPADSPVKDQAACGSCWAFGAVGSLETALFRATGRQQLLSEQHMIDCAWDFGNGACLGGYQNKGFQWALDHGGIASEDAYPYQGVSQFCRRNVTNAANFTGDYYEVNGTEEALKEALFSKGPMTVSVDASSPEFRFYKTGVFRKADCGVGIDQLDHAVLVSGYGTTEEGEDYWIVKNTWSVYWGEQGYVRIARRPNDCGIATQPWYIDLEVSE